MFSQQRIRPIVRRHTLNLAKLKSCLALLGCFLRCQANWIGKPRALATAKNQNMVHVEHHRRGKTDYTSR